jgi:hypothetical protein
MTMTTATITAKATKTTRSEEPEWIVLVVVAVALLAGWFLKLSVEGQTETFSDGTISLSYPTTWLREPALPGEALVMKASDLHSTSLYRPNIAIHLTQAAPALPGADDRLTPTVTTWTFGNSQKLSHYRVLATEKVEIASQPAIKIDYTYISEPIASPYRRALPVVVEAVDYVILNQDQAYVVTLAADAQDFEPEQGRFKTILSSLSFKS